MISTTAHAPRPGNYPRRAIQRGTIASVHSYFIWVTTGWEQSPMGHLEAQYRRIVVIVPGVVSLMAHPGGRPTGTSYEAGNSLV